MPNPWDLTCESPLGTRVPQWLRLGIMAGLSACQPSGAGRPGFGELKLRVSGSERWLAWRAQRSDSFGAEVDVAAGGDFVLPGPSGFPERYCRVTSVAGELPGVNTTATIRLRERRNALAGSERRVVTLPATPPGPWSVRLVNRGADTLSDLRIWLRPGLDASRRTVISLDGVTFAAPRNAEESDATLGAQTLTAGSNLTLSLDYPQPPGDPTARLLLASVARWSDGAGGYQWTQFQGRGSVRTAEAYRAYARAAAQGAPDENDLVASGSSLPLALPALADGDWLVDLEQVGPTGMPSGLGRPRAVRILGGAGVDLLAGPVGLVLARRSDGTIAAELTAAPGTGGQAAPDGWRLKWTTDGSAPDSTAPSGGNGIDLARPAGQWRRSYDGAPDPAAGQTLRVRLWLLRGVSVSTGFVEATIVRPGSALSAPTWGTG